jgi:hypothetical protein
MVLLDAQNGLMMNVEVCKGSTDVLSTLGRYFGRLSFMRRLVSWWCIITHLEVCGRRRRICG